jgi:hypothetical protein
MFSVLASTMGCSPGGVKLKTKKLVFAVPLLNMLLLHEGTKYKSWFGRRQDNVSIHKQKCFIYEELDFKSKCIHNNSLRRTQSACI